MRLKVLFLIGWLAVPSWALNISEEGQREARLFNTFLKAVYAQQGQPQRQFDTLQEALALAPDSVYLQRLLVAAALAMNRPELAEPYAGFITQGEPEAEDWAVYAAYQMQKGNVPEVLAAYEKALEKQPDNTELLYAYLLVLSVHDADKTVSVLEQFARQQPQAAAQAYTQIGRLYMNRQQWDKALAYLDKAVSADPQDPAPRLARGEIYEKTSQLFLMLHEFEELDKMGYGTAGIYSRMGAVFLLVKDLPKSRLYFSKALEADPADSASNYFLSLLDEADGNYEQAVLHLQAASDYAQKAAWWLQVSSLQQKMDRPQDSLQTLARAYQRFDGNVEIGFFYGLALNDRKQYRRAVRVFEKLLRTNPNYTEACLHYAYGLESLKKYREMEIQLRRILEEQPQHAAALNLWAYSLAERNVRLAEAQEYITRALAVSPQDISFQDTLGWIYVKQGNLDAAEKIFFSLPEETISQYPEIAYHAGVLRYKQNRPQEALYYLEKSRTGWPAAEKLYREIVRQQKKI